MLQISSSIQPKMINLIKDLQEAEVLEGGYIVFDEKDEPKVNKIFEKYL